MARGDSNAVASSSRSAAPTKRKHQSEDVPPSDNDDYSNESSSSDETEDEDGEELTPAMDAAILRTLAKIKRKDGVYGTENILQEELRKTALQAERLQLVRKSQRKDKAFTLQDHQRLALLNSDPSLDPNDPDAFVPPSTTIPLTHVQEERALREEVTQAFHAAAADDEDEDEDDGFLQKKDDKAVDEDREAYRKFMLESGGGEEAVREILGLGSSRDEDHVENAVALTVIDEVDDALGGKKKKKKQKTKERTKEKDDEFLMNYILNRGWVDTEDPTASTSKAGRAAAFSEDEGDAEDAKGQASAHPWGALDEEDEFDEKAEEFETAYNFRFEEPGAAEIPSHPRVIPQAVRRTDDSRKLARQARAERKAAERAAREEETRRLKGAKRREIEKRLHQLKRELGEKALEGLDLEGDWDEEAHDREMKRLYDAEEEDDEEKPTWGDEEMPDVEQYPEDDGAYTEQKGGEAQEDVQVDEVDADEDGPINMDADFIALPDDRREKKKKRKEKKKKNRENRANASAAEGDGVVDLAEEEGLSAEAKKEKVKQAMEEYRQLDAGGKPIGDMPTRFKYAKTLPVSFGLTPAEILLATEAELNSIVSMKHLAPYRSPHNLGAAGRGLNKRVQELKQKLAQRRWGEEYQEDDSTARDKDAGWKGKVRTNSAQQGADGQAGTKKKRMGKKERMKAAKREGEGGDDGDVQPPAKRVKV